MVNGLHQCLCLFRFDICAHIIPSYKRICPCRHDVNPCTGTHITISNIRLESTVCTGMRVSYISKAFKSDRSDDVKSPKRIPNRKESVQADRISIHIASRERTSSQVFFQPSRARSSLMYLATRANLSLSKISLYNLGPSPSANLPTSLRR